MRELFSSLRYLAARVRHRDAPSGRYLRMGMGIERRARNLAAYWRPHQDQTRAAQRRWSASGEVLTVLGAGRLMDFEPALAPRFRSLRLVDADPLCEPAWRAAGLRYEPVFTDISGCADRWVAWLNGCPRAEWASTLDRIRERGENAEPAYSPQGDSILSLNVLSQIPIAWQDGVESYLWKRFGRPQTAAREAEWLAAVQPGARALVQQQLAAIERSRVREALIVTDLEYVEYSGRRYSRRKWAPEPVQWRDGAWVPAGGVRYEASTALYGVNLEDPETWRRFTPSYAVEWTNSWLWHIAPMGAECPQCGTLHRVGAFALRRITDDTQTRSS